jgi:hypothetical protein
MTVRHWSRTLPFGKRSTIHTAFRQCASQVLVCYVSVEDIAFAAITRKDRGDKTAIELFLTGVQRWGSRVAAQIDVRKPDSL